MAREEKTKEKRVPVEEVKNAILYSDGSILVSNVRASYPHLDKPYKKDGDKGTAKYGVVGLLGKTSHKAAKKLIDARIDELLKENKVRALASDKKFLRDGDEAGKEENEGCWTISAREDRRPAVRDEDGEKIEEPEEIREKIYGGCYISMLIRPWYQNNDFGKRANAGLTAVKFKKDGEPFGQGRITDEEVDDAFEGDTDMDDDEDERPRRSSSKSKSRYDDDDEDDKPKRKPARRSRDDDDDDDDL